MKIIQLIKNFRNKYRSIKFSVLFFIRTKVKKDTNIKKLMLNKIVDILKTNLGYEDSDFFYVSKNDTIIVCNNVAFKWNDKINNYVISFSSDCNVRASVLLINELHKNNVHNIVIASNFYISKFQTSPDKIVVYTGEEADSEFVKDIKKSVFRDIVNEMNQMKLLISDSCETVH